MKSKPIKKALIARGANPALVWLYVSAASIFEMVTKEYGLLKSEDAHVLPKKIWLEFDKSDWNHAQIAWGLHVALHWILVVLFPDDQKVRRAVSAVRIGRLGSKYDGFVDEVKNLANRGFCIKQTAKILGIVAESDSKFTSFRCWAKSRGIKFKRPPSKYDKFLFEAKKLAEQGLTTTEAARKLNIDMHALYEIAHRRGVKFQSGANRKKLDARAKDVSEFAKRGVSKAEAARNLGVRCSTLRRWLRNNPIKFKSPRIFALHIRWHVNRGIAKQSCSFCEEKA